MSTSQQELWIAAMRQTVASYRNMIDAVVEQLTDEELFARPATNINSVAIIIRHLGGNLRSRWTDFMTTDGEKRDRNRDTEFEDWEGDRQSLIEHFDRGWKCLEDALASLDGINMHQAILVRGEAQPVALALTRSVTHLSYHVGQITMIGRMVHQGEWRWLTIAPGTSQSFNESTWGTAASRGVASKDDES